MKNPMNSSPLAVLARPKLNGLGEHWGVALPNGWVVHNTIERGKHVVPYQDFAQNRPVRVVRYVPRERTDDTIARLFEELSSAQRYHLISDNCETFANKVTGEKPESDQVKGWLSALAIIALVWTGGKR